VRERLEALWPAVRSGDATAVAPFLAYAGPDRERRYREPARYEDDQKLAIERVAARIAGHLAAGTPHFERFETRAKGEQSWLAWHLTFGEGEKARKALYAFVQVGTTWVLGDID
jgi:hypothetical protein